MEEKTHGGARVGAGRKPKAEEIAIAEQMDAIMIPNRVWSALSIKAIEGDVNAIKTWLGYRFGMPKQMIESTNLNIQEKDLTLEEIELIKESLKREY